MKKFAIILNGCGPRDGSEIHESVSAMYAIDRQGASYQIFAPDREQQDVINHLTRESMPEKRNCMTEAARIARGNVLPLDTLKAEDFDALVIPGGFGSAKNLFSFAFEGEHFQVQDDVAGVIRDFRRLGKPIGAMCISPLMLASVIEGATVTMGQDAHTSAIVENMGGHAVPTQHGEAVYDAKYNLYSTPCYMLDARISDIFDGAFALIGKMLENMH